MCHLTRGLQRLIGVGEGARVAPIAGALVAAVAVSLPWSTSATSIFAAAVCDSEETAGAGPVRSSCDPGDDCTFDATKRRH